MTEKQLKELNVPEVLTDAGCDKEMIGGFLEIAGNDKKLSKWLDKRRCEILDKVHTHTKELDCLDYLIYQMKKHIG